MFRCHGTPPPAHATTQWLHFSPLRLRGTSGRPERFFKCKNELKSPGASSSLCAGCSNTFTAVISLSRPPIFYLEFLHNPRTLTASIKIPFVSHDVVTIRCVSAEKFTNMTSEVHITLYLCRHQAIYNTKLCKWYCISGQIHAEDTAMGPQPFCRLRRK